VVPLGRGRATRYARLRTVRDLPPALSGASRSLPWFMTDMRPQGFLGRLFPRTWSVLDLPDRVGDWTEDQALYAIARRGWTESAAALLRQRRIAPAYDVLPMAYAPVRDEVPAREITLPPPRPGHADQWLAALPVALAFWQALAEDAQVSAEFRAIAHRHACLLGKARP